METINPFAIYDTLFVGNKLQRYIGDFNSSLQEAHHQTVATLREATPAPVQVPATAAPRR